MLRMQGAVHNVTAASSADLTSICSAICSTSTASVAPAALGPSAAGIGALI